MNRKLLTYGPGVLLALLCAAAFATGALTRYPVLEAQVQAMDFPNGTADVEKNNPVKPLQLLFVGKDADNRRHLLKVQINGLVLRDPFDVVARYLLKAVSRKCEFVALDREFNAAFQNNAYRHFRHCPPPRFLLRSRPCSDQHSRRIAPALSP